MEKTKNFMKTKKTLVIAIVCILVIVVALIIILVSSGSKDKAKSASEEERLTQYLEEIGRDFYETKYQPQMTEDFLSGYTDLGIKIKLSSLSRLYAETNKEEIESFTKAKCDEESTRVIIYPKAPYGAEDYTIEVELTCEF